MKSVRRVVRYGLFGAAVLALGMVMSACTGATSLSSLDPQLQEARTLNSELRAEWTQTDDTLKSTLTQVEQFPSIPIDVSKVDMKLVQKALTEVFNGESKKAAKTVSSVSTQDEAVAAGEAAQGGGADCTDDGGDSMSALKDYMRQAPEEIGSFINGKLISVCTIKTNIKERLPTMATEMGERYLAAQVKLKELQVTADTLKTAADNNPLLDAAGRSKFNNQYEELQTEMKAIEELLSTMESEVTELPNKVRETLEKFTYGLANFGQGG